MVKTRGLVEKRYAFITLLHFEHIYRIVHDVIFSNNLSFDQVLVQLGDILDRGEDEIAILSLLRSLQIQAKEHGGAVFQVGFDFQVKWISIISQNSLLNCLIMLGEWKS